MKIKKICFLVICFCIFSVALSKSENSLFDNLTKEIPIQKEKSLFEVDLEAQKDNSTKVKSLFEETDKIDNSKVNIQESTNDEKQQESPIETQKPQPELNTNNTEHINKSKSTTSHIDYLSKIEDKLAKENLRDLNELEQNFKNISENTNKVKDSLRAKNAHQTIQGIPDRIKTLNLIIEKYSNSENQIKQIKDEILKMDNYLNKLEKKQNIVIDDITNNALSSANVEKEVIANILTTGNLLANQVQIGKLNLENDLIEIPTGFLLNIQDKEQFTIEDIINFNKSINLFRENCGDNIDCLINKEDEDSEISKEDMIEHAILRIENKLEKIK